MNTELIYYRAWNKRDGVMHTPEEIEQNNWALGSHGIMVAHEKDSDHLFNLDHFLVPLLCTRKKDRHGKFIFQGDIVIFYQDGDFDREPEKPALIIWDEFDSKFAEESKLDIGNYPLDLNPEYYEVVGDIYRAPELLESKNGE